MSAAFDASEIATAALGARFHKPVAPMVAHGARVLATVRAVALEDASTGKMKKGAFIMGDVPGDAVSPMNAVKIFHGGRVARFPLQAKDAEDAKRVRDLMGTGGAIQSIKRNTVGSFDLEMGTVFTAVLGMNESELPRAGFEYVLSISEVSTGEYGLQFMVSSVKKEGSVSKMSVTRLQTLMAAMLHSTQCQQHLEPLVYTGEVEKKDELRKLPRARYTPETRPLKNASLFLPLVRDFPLTLFSARLVRGLSAKFMPDPALSLWGNMHWPAIVENKGKVEKFPRLVYRIDLVEKVLRDPQFKDRILSKDDFDKAYATYEPSCDVTVSGVYPLAAFGVADDRHWFNHGAWRYLMVAMPALIPVFLSGDPLHQSQVVADMTQYQLNFRNASPKDSRSEWLVNAFLFEAVVNAGYPVSQKAAFALLEALAAKHGKRYNADMAYVPSHMRKMTVMDESMDIPANRAQRLEEDTSIVLNMRETSEATRTMSADDWVYCVVPNLAAKCETSNSLGFACLRDLVAEHGEDAAADILGDAFVTLANDRYITTPENVANAFRPEEPRKFDFLLFAVSRRAIRQAGYSLCSSRNHVGALERIYARLYPADLSDMADSVHAPTTVQPIASSTVQPAATPDANAPTNKRAADEDDVPAAKRVATADEEMAGVDADAFEEDE